MKPLTVAAATVIGAAGLGLVVAAWLAWSLPPQPAQPPPPKPTILAQAPLSTTASTPKAIQRTAPAALSQPGVPENKVTDEDDSKWGIGEPVDPETYLAARDRAAAHSARSR
jgi:hypothetical protein